MTEELKETIARTRVERELLMMDMLHIGQLENSMYSMPGEWIGLGGEPS